jgi:hypothetical protein
MCNLAELLGADISLRLFNEVEMRTLHDDLAIWITVHKHFISITLVSCLDRLNALPQISLLLLMETIFVILVAQVVDN